MDAHRLFFTIGRPVAPVYSAAMRLREHMYRLGLLSSYAFAVPVISVGNLTMGGTGKTPMVQYIARLLQGQGYRPAVVSRGYGGKARGRVNVVSDGARLLLDADMAGDEPRFLAETLPGVPVLTGIVRRLAVEQAQAMGVDAVILDDGFQHLQVARDINLVLFSADRLAGNSRVFPGGELREPVAALRRATHFILTGINERNKERAERFSLLLCEKFPHASVLKAGYIAGGVVQVSGGALAEPVAGAISDLAVFAFCGIARPASFQQTVQEQGMHLAGFRPLADHQIYSERLIAALVAEAMLVGADCLVTTEKDLVKLAPVAHRLPLPLYGLRMQVEADESFDQEILSFVARKKAGQTVRGQM